MLHQKIDPAQLARLGSLPIKARVIVEGALSGMHRASVHGSSVEFSEHKEYSPGDELRHIDWRAYAKGDRYYVKQYEQESQLTVYLVLDAGDPSWVQRFDFRAVVRYAFRHGEIEVAWTQLGTVSALGAAGYFIAWFFFRLQGDRAARMLGWIERNHFRGPQLNVDEIVVGFHWLRSRLLYDVR